jgi:hypothetical protein
MAVKCLKLISGEEIIGEVISGNNGVTIDNPMVLVATQEGLAVMPWLPLASSSRDFVIENSFIMLSYVPKTELVNHYRERTGGIVTAGPGVLNQLSR